MIKLNIFSLIKNDIKLNLLKYIPSDLPEPKRSGALIHSLIFVIEPQNREHW